MKKFPWKYLLTFNFVLISYYIVSLHVEKYICTSLGVKILLRWFVDKLKNFSKKEKMNGRISSLWEWRIVGVGWCKWTSPVARTREDILRKREKLCNEPRAREEKEIIQVEVNIFFLMKEKNHSFRQNKSNKTWMVGRWIIFSCSQNQILFSLQHSLSISLTTPNLRMTKFSTQTTQSTQNQAKIYQFDPISSDKK